MENKFKSFIIPAVIIVVAIIGVIVYTASQNNDMSMNAQTQQVDTANATQTDKVMIMDYKYAPAAIKVKKGTKVTWTNEDTVRHSVTSEDGAPVSFDSKLFGKGETYSYTFEKAGSYNYYCTPHPYMKGTVVVTE